MKRTLIVLMLAHPIASIAQTNIWQELCLRLEGVTAVMGSAVGRGGTPGEFYTLSLDFLSTGSEADFQQMMTSTSRITRLMGLYCVMNARTNVSEVCIPPSMLRDTTKVPYASGGCFWIMRPAADVAAEFIRNPECLSPSRRVQQRK